MTEEHQLPSDSDEDDEDYVPDGADSEPVSEVESEGDAESGPEDENDENRRETTKKRGRRSSKGAKSKVKKRRKSGKNVKNEGEEKEEKEKESAEKKKLTEEEEKKRADSLWADFMKDTGEQFKFIVRIKFVPYANDIFVFLSQESYLKVVHKTLRIN